MKKKNLFICIVALTVVSIAQAGTIKSITATTVGTAFSSLTRMLTMNGITAISVQDIADIVVTYGSGSFSLNTTLISDTSSGGIASGNFAFGSFSYNDAGSTVLLSGSISSLSLVEIYNGSGIFVGTGSFAVTGGSLQPNFGQAGNMVDISFSVNPKNIANFSTSFTASSNMTVLPIATIVRTVGQLVIKGNSETQINASTWQISGNITINDVIRCTGTVTANTSTMRVSGNGEVWVDGVPLLGNVKIYNGVWEFNGQNAATTSITKALSGLKVAGLNVKVEAIEVVSSGVKLRGTIVMPSVLNGAELAINGYNYIQISPTNGVSLSGAAVTVPNASNLKFMGLAFKYSNVELQYANSELQLRGALAMPSVLGGTTIDLSSDDNHLLIRNVSGNAKVEVVGNLYVAGPVVLGPGFSVQDMAFTLDTVDNILKANGTLNIPAGFGIGAGIGFANGDFDYVEADFVDMEYPIIMVGVVPVVYWQDADIVLENLAYGPPSVVLTGHVAFTAGPMIGDNYLLRLDGTAVYDTAGQFRGTVEVLLGGGDDPFQVASALVIIDKTYGLYISGNMTLAGIINANGELRVDIKNNMQGKLTGSITAPKSFGGITLADVILYGQYINNSDDSDDYFVAKGKIGWIWKFEHAVSFNLHTGKRNWNAGLDLVKEIEVIPPSSGMRAMSAAAMDNGFYLPTGIQGAVFELTWDSNDTDFTLMRPDQTVITIQNHASFEGVDFYKDPNNHTAMCGIALPQAGQWQVQVTNTTGIGTYKIRVLKTTGSPTVAIIEPAQDVDSNMVTISWVDAHPDSNATVSLYYDNNRDGWDGTLITSVNESNDTGLYNWNTSGIPSGAYYIYAKIQDDIHVPEFSYSVGRVIVHDPNAPGSPGGISAITGDEPCSVILTWQDPNCQIDHYEVLIAKDASGEYYTQTVSAGKQTSTIIHDIMPGRYCRMTVVAYGPNDVGSDHAEPILVQIEDINNNPPHLNGTIPTLIKTGSNFQIQVFAEDADNDEIDFELVSEPNGMTISSTGVISWAPQNNQSGKYTFSLQLNDNKNGVSEQQFNITVVDTNTSGYAPEIISSAPPTGRPNDNYMYQIRAYDPDSNDTLAYYVLDGPNNVSINQSGLLQWQTNTDHGWYEFLIEVRDNSGRFDLQRFMVLVDTNSPCQNDSGWMSHIAESNSITIVAQPQADNTGPIEFIYEQNAVADEWQKANNIKCVNLQINTVYTFRYKTRDNSLQKNESVWSDSIDVCTLAVMPDAPLLTAIESNAVVISLSSGQNPADTPLALFNVSSNKWIDHNGVEVEVPVWDTMANWGTLRIKDLSFGTTYAFKCKVKNSDGIETDFGPELIVKTTEPPSVIQTTISTPWIYTNTTGSTTSQVSLSVAFTDDPYHNTDYSYSWDAVVDSDTGKALMIIGGAGLSDANAIYAAPDTNSVKAVVYKVICTITGNQHGNSVTKIFTIEVSPLLYGDINGDGTVDFTDYAFFANWFNSNIDLNWSGQGDFNNDKLVDLSDLDIFCQNWLQKRVQLDVIVAGDINLDASVDFPDLVIIANQWLQAPGIPSADIAPDGGDGIVNMLDFAVFAENWLVEQ